MALDQPKRIQRRRTKGWRMPPNTVYVGRPTIWGNPFTMENPIESVEHYRAWLDGSMQCPAGLEEQLATVLANLPALRGKNLACFCPLDQPCHASILLELANR